MASNGSYLDGLLKLVLRIFANGSFLGSVGGGTTGINLQSPLTATVNQSTQNIDVGIGSVNSLTFAPTTAPNAPASGWIVYSDSNDSNRIKAISDSGKITYLQGWTDSGTLYSGAFTAAMNTIHPYNFQTAASISFPAANAAMAGQSIAFVNMGTGATASIFVAQGTATFPASLGHGTAAGPASGQSIRYTYSALVNSWLPGI